MSALIKRLALPAMVLIWSASYFIEVSGYSKKNQYLIKPVFIVMVLLFIVNTITDVREWKKEQREKKELYQETAGRSPDMTGPTAEEKQTLLRSFFVVLSMAVYIVVMPYLGFVISTIVLVVFLLALMQVRKPIPMILLPVLLTGVLYAAFKMGLHIPLPAGFLGF